MQRTLLRRAMTSPSPPPRLAGPAAPAPTLVKIGPTSPLALQVLTVAAAGTTVTWVNDDDTPHTVVDNDHAFHSKADRHRRAVLDDFQQARRLRLFLLAPSPHDRQVVSSRRRIS